MAYNFFRPLGGRFGTMSVTISSGQIGGANYQGGATPLTANTTTIFRLGSPPAKSRFVSMAVSTVTVPLDSDGTILAVPQKYTGSAKNLTGNIDLEALTTRQLLVTKATASEADRTFNGTTDVLEVTVTNNSAAIDTQPAGLCFTALFEMLV